MCDPLLQQDDPPAARQPLTRALQLFEPISPSDTLRVREQPAALPAG